MFKATFAALISLMAAVSGAPTTFSIPPTLLEARLSAWKAGDPSVKPAVNQLIRSADKALGMLPSSVMDKKLLPPGGDRHDYYSFGIYWWPDPEKPDGLPYIRKDGVVNPASREGIDSVPFGRTNHAVLTLGLAYFFSGKEAYAAKAAELARVWYLDAGTRMNPNFNHAQAVPGRNDGRGIGLIEASTLPDLMDGIALIRPSEAWTEQDDAGMTEWLGAFYRWLRTSRNGLDQEKASNNHGVYYDVLASHLALYLGKKEEAEKRLRDALVRRVDAQIRPDGKQPHELKRTISFSYTIFNTDAFLQLATLGESVGVDYWNHRGPQGQGLEPAMDLLAPYADREKPWELGQQIKPVGRSSILPFLQQALRYEENPGYRSLLEKHGSEKKDERWRLTR
ncbi:alginate lyase family protein [Luteolibacter sp. SL250]|uniref:alginate lyase family protein n=1 Tax=Luteolibacter sp. SL250 TaxID=2995170 RepID=UPI0022700E62|nr:alginate lyase family protein [Luteolibacter sp. SL250]WAC18618.1 alginate lyase family protein [Luteolibacter sp. SL250]